MNSDLDFPDAHFGTLTEEQSMMGWPEAPDEDDPDDEILGQTPEDVTALLGFDPLDLPDEEK